MVRVIYCHSATFSFEVISPHYLPPLILNHSLFSSMTSVLLSPSLQHAHPMNLSLPVTLTFISIILQTLSPLSFCLFSPFNLSQHVHFPTHDKNRILDLVITSSDTSLAPVVSFTHWFPSDHFPVFTRLSINPTPLPPPTLHSFRQLHSIDVGSFLTDLKSSQLITGPPKSLGPLLSAFNTTLSSLLDKHAPIVTKLSRRQSPSNPWFLPRDAMHPRY